jgi:phage terminase small subunit
MPSNKTTPNSASNSGSVSLPPDSPQHHPSVVFQDPPNESTSDPLAPLAGSLPLEKETWETFATSYAKSGNAKQSARDAGIPEVNAGQMSFNWSRNPKIMARVDYLREQAKKAEAITEGDIIEQLGVILKSNVDDFMVDQTNGLLSIKPDKNGNIDPRKMMAIESITTTEQINGTRKVSFKLWNKVSVLQLAMQWKNMLKSKGKDEGSAEKDQKETEMNKNWKKLLSQATGIPEEDLPS